MKTATVVTLAYLNSERSTYQSRNNQLRDANSWEYISDRKREHFPKTLLLNRKRRPDGSVSELLNWNQEKVIDLEELMDSRAKKNLVGMAFIDNQNNEGVADRIRRNAFSIKVDGDGVAIRSEGRVIRVAPELGFDTLGKSGNARQEEKRTEQIVQETSASLAQSKKLSAQHDDLRAELDKYKQQFEEMLVQQKQLFENRLAQFENRLAQHEQLFNEFQQNRRLGFWRMFWR
jgi:hypothetical protein